MNNTGLLRKFDVALIEESVRNILIAIGENPDREGLLDTPKRVAKMYSEIFAGLREECEPSYTSFVECKYNNPVILNDIDFYSMCEHHMLPFYGKINIAYLPDVKLLGISKLARIVESQARKLQIQENLCVEIVKEIEKAASPKGVVVTIEAEHLCMSMRGVKKSNAKTFTMTSSGVYEENSELRKEVMSQFHFYK
jgi:GTP cyclohydrolase IA